MAREDDEDVGQETEKISPSAFMRQLRPEYYSDTEDRAAYLLDEATLGYQLNSVTERNETHGFEIFCRKLCERVICPNLKPQTGPEGGGDSKADAETYPVSEELTRLWYSGDAEGGKERWAFAFSAKQTWSQKVRDDVKGLVETGRGYTKIFFVTSRPARAKDRARVEGELSKQYGIQITILDRSWITKEIIENDRKDLAFNYLHVGQMVDNPSRLGPEDYSRRQQLESIEKSLVDPASFEGMKTQQVTEALVAAKLSRNLELPRIETDGRFTRAVRLAEAQGTKRQYLEIRYEQIWTAFWWFDDIAFLNREYDGFAELALTSEHASDLEFLCNLTQLLVNAIVHRHLTPDEAKLKERASKLRSALEALVGNKERPNNSLEAQTALLMLGLNEAVLRKRPDELEPIWTEFRAVLRAAKGLGEFNAERLVNLIEVFGNIAGADDGYGELVEAVAEFVSERESEARGALILLKRASQLDFNRRFEIIRLLGKAVRKLTKKEHADKLIDATRLLALAYKSAGLLWAARASAIFSCASIVIESEPDSELRVDIVPTLKMWAWVSFELRHFPEFLCAIQILNGCLAKMPLAEESKQRVQNDLHELDMALASQMASLTVDELAQVTTLPDILETLGLFTARTALLYVLGHQSVLREDGSLPAVETDADVHELMTRLGSEGLRHKGRGPIVLNADHPQVFQTTILGMAISVHHGGSDTAILAAEAILGTLEAFFATALDMRVLPHAESFRIKLVEVDDAEKPVFALDNVRMSGELKWPSNLAVTSFEHSDLVGDVMFEIVAHVLATACMMPDPKQTLSQLFENELVQDRVSMISLIGNSHHRFLGDFVTRLSDWEKLEPKSYPVLPSRPSMTLSAPKDDFRPEDGPAVGPEHVGGGISATSHSAITVRSVINPHLWDEAQWTGALYAWGPDGPPMLGLAYRNGDAARQIFEQWKERFGSYDEREEIYLAIVRNLPGENPHHYKVMVSSNLEPLKGPANTNFVVASRKITMTPDTSQNLDAFLSKYEEFGQFGLIPAAWSEGKQPEPFYPLIIGKARLVVRNAADIKEGEMDYMALDPEHRPKK